MEDQLLQTPTSAQRLVNFWTTLGCTLPPGASSQQIAAFEAQHHVCLPSDLREYFSLCNGLPATGEGQWDHEWLWYIDFWPLEQISPVSSEIPVPPELGPSDAYFIFAGFFIHAHLYAIRLTQDPANACPIIAFGPPCVVIAPTFSDFVVAYLEEPDRVVQPW